MSRDNHHDSLFRLAFSRPLQAADHFRRHLPAAVVEAVRWETLELQDGSFVDPELQNLHTDLLYRVRLKGEGELLLYVLLEHQSRVDYLMPFRVLQYLTRIWDRWLSEDKSRRRLPVVVPMVVYHGQRNWTAPIDFAALFEAPLRDALNAYVPSFVYDLQDLSRIPDAQLAGEALQQLVLLWLKYADRDDFWRRFPEWIEALVRVTEQPPDGMKALEALLRYLVLVTPGEPPREVYALLAERLAPQSERWLVTWAEQLQERGRQEENARWLNKMRTQTLQMLRLKFGELSDEVTARVEAASEEELDQWAGRLLAVDTLEELFE
jgi:predicted transposase YdaD